MATGLFCAFQMANASSAISIQTSFYAVSGNDSSSIHRSIQLNGPVGKNGKRYHAVTKWNTQWSYRWIETGSLCRLTRVDVDLDVEYLLPELTSINSKPERLKKNWEKYFQALFKHEQQHKNYGVQAANELEKELLSIKDQQTCTMLEALLASTARKVLDKYDRIEKEFDRVTNHGLNQGIKLP